ncbi:ParA family protein [Clostridium autoethanogenum]|uniref:AAA family ATPase n=1 Tax=Clostridium autoethanogenum DSM 10061 TaxID=1341692 RepID=A0ABN4BJE7_9CLOT|nr:AAA family ATPase [Clostridium autoethanogenum]AGY77727.1 AAA family ATPase [Clostridium autoethanogenum DSM 10061]ALU37865.1 Cobyrinic acid a,c-diamide synthase [Clostridium autoethanogenum DSM 10061]OVY49784.1 Sporulation initiation inhibitor protein Soj [Clostridium autoethanogenum]
MGKVISFINLKGGVGKTTTAVAIAEFLTYEFNQKVLVVDLDPQTNATILLIDQDTWKKANENNKTIHQMFFDELNGTKAFDIKESIIKRTSNIKGGNNNLHLLPSSINLIDLSDRLSELDENHEVNDHSIPILSKYLTKKLINRYDYVLIDCPPNLGLITLNGIYISDYYVIPVIPDILSTYGIPQMLNKIESSKRKLKMLNPSYNLSELGLIINKMIKRSTMHKRTLEDLQSRQAKPKKDPSYVPKLFESIIYQRDISSNIADFCQTINTVKKKYGNNYTDYRNLTLEFMSRSNL